MNTEILTPFSVVIPDTDFVQPVLAEYSAMSQNPSKLPKLTSHRVSFLSVSQLEQNIEIQNEIPNILQIEDYFRTQPIPYENPSVIHSLKNNRFIKPSPFPSKFIGSILTNNGFISLPQNNTPNVSYSPFPGTQQCSPNNNSSARSVFGEKVIQPEDLAEMALPVIDFIKKVQPHLVVGCDRGGRMFSLAVHAAWRRVTDGTPFPTLDRKVHFARISKTENEGVLQMQFDAMVATAKKQAEMSGRPLPEDKQLRVLFIDDWVCRGGTRRLTEKLAGKHGAQTYFAVMRGDDADVSGWPGENWAKPDWSDDSSGMGINYVTAVVDGHDGTYYETQRVLAIRSEAARSNRQRMHAAINKLGVISEPIAA